MALTVRCIENCEPKKEKKTDVIEDFSTQWAKIRKEMEQEEKNEKIQENTVQNRSIIAKEIEIGYEEIS